MAKFWKKKTVVLDPLSIELDEFEVSYLFITQKDNEQLQSFIKDMDYQWPSDNFVYHCEDESEKEFILSLLPFSEIND